MNRITDRCKNITFPQLRFRAVTTHYATLLCAASYDKEVFIYTCSFRKDELHDMVMFTSAVFRYRRSISYSLKKRHCDFPSLYWISIISRIRRIQLESVKHDWRLLIAFLCLTHSWLFGVVVKTPGLESIGCQFKYRKFCF